MTRLTLGEILLCLGSGTLTALAMPGIDWMPLVAFSLIPFFYVLERRRGMVPGLLFGIAFFAIDLRWMISL
ncbi:MAG TPA: hypothetical protein ENN96_01730, partial [Candidatus Acetothermia bacterium]|nr:hypothetical protein [Candidatus Acetothermia bacterium]